MDWIYILGIVLMTTAFSINLFQAKLYRDMRIETEKHLKTYAEGIKELEIERTKLMELIMRVEVVRNADANVTH